MPGGRQSSSGSTARSRVNGPAAAGRGLAAAAIALVWLAVGALIVAPLSLIALRGVLPRVLEGSLAGPFSRWPDVLGRPEVREAILNSAQLAVVVTVGAVAVGTIAGYLLAHDDLPAGRALGALLLLPLLTPPYVAALAWMLVMQPNGFLDQLSGRQLSDLGRLFLSVWGIAGVMILHLYPLVLVPARIAFAAAGGRHGAVARLSGAGPWQSFRTVTLPLAIPACIGGALLVLAATLEEFGVAATLGRLAGYWVLPTEIHRLVSTFPSDQALAATLSLLLILVMLVVFLLQRRVQQQVAFVFSARVAGEVPQRLGRWRWPAFAALLGLALLGIVPWVGALLTSLLRAVSRGLRLDNLTAERYGELLVAGPAQQSLTTSVVQAAIAATAAATLGLAVAYIAARARAPGARALDGISLLPAAIPSIVIAIAILTLWNLSPVPDSVYRSPIILAICYTALHLPHAVRYATAGLAARPASLEWAARVSGASAPRAWAAVLLPALRPWLLATWLLVFAVSARELVSSLLVRPAGTTTTAVYIYQHFEQGDLGQGMAMAMVTLTLTGAVLVVAQRVAAGPRPL